MLVRNNLNDIMQPGKPLPSNELMVKKALEILELSPHGQQLSNFAERKEINVVIIQSLQPSTHVTEDNQVIIGFNKNNPLSPSRFILMLINGLREAQQNMSGMPHPPLHAPEEEHLQKSMAKYEDIVWYMCTIAIELNEIDELKPFNFLDELRKIGYNESLFLIEKQRETLQK